MAKKKPQLPLEVLPDLLSWWRKAKVKGVIIGGLAGDGGILSAMRSNEDDTNQAYEQALTRSDIAPALQNLLTGNLADASADRGLRPAALTAAILK